MARHTARHWRKSQLCTGASACDDLKGSPDREGELLYVAKERYMRSLQVLRARHWKQLGEVAERASLLCPFFASPPLWFSADDSIRKEVSRKWYTPYPSTFADKVFAAGLKEDIIRFFFFLRSEEWVPELKTVQLVFENTPEHSSLRSLMVDW